MQKIRFRLSDRILFCVFLRPDFLVEACNQQRHLLGFFLVKRAKPLAKTAQTLAQSKCQVRNFRGFTSVASQALFTKLPHLSPLQAADFAQLLLESGNDRQRNCKRSWKTEILKYCMCWVNPPHSGCNRHHQDHQDKPLTIFRVAFRKQRPKASNLPLLLGGG